MSLFATTIVQLSHRILSDLLNCVYETTVSLPVSH